MHGVQTHTIEPCYYLLSLGKGDTETMNFFNTGKIRRIIRRETGQNAIIQVIDVLLPIYQKKPGNLTGCERNIMYIYELESEVNNGGFDQYFYNSPGSNVNETIKALESVESKIFLQILIEARNKFPDGDVPKNQNERQEILLNMREDNSWDELECLFYKYEENLSDLQVKYISKNIENFR